MAVTGLLKDKTCLVTGATNGIGRATVLRMAEEDANLVIMARDKKRGDEVAHFLYETQPTVEAEVLLCDLSSQASIRKAVQDFSKRHDRLDVLANVASVYKAKEEVTKDGVEMMWATNHFGPFLLTNLLLPQLKKAPDARVLTVAAPSPAKIDFQDLPRPKQFQPLKVFTATNAAKVLFGLELARRTKETSITSNVVHPGLVRTQLMREAPAAIRYFLLPFSRSPKRAAELLTLLASAKPLSKYSGRFYKKYEPTKPPKFTRDPANQKRLWEISAKVTRLSAA